MAIYPSKWSAMDIRHWRLECGSLYGGCPNCGASFADMHPAQNLVPHWQGDCIKLIDEQFLKSLHIAPLSPPAQ